MNDNLIPIVAMLVPIVAIVGGIAVAIASILAKEKTRQLEIRERIAMIEKGLVPPPEVDPRGFDRAMGRLEHRPGQARARHRRGGIMLIGVGFGLMLLIGVAGDNVGAAIGVGGFLVVLGLALLLNSWLEARSAQSPSSPLPSGPTEPPSESGS